MQILERTRGLEKGLKLVADEGGLGVPTHSRRRARVASALVQICHAGSQWLQYTRHIFKRKLVQRQQCYLVKSNWFSYFQVAC